MSDLAEIVDALAGLGCRPHRSGASYAALCPAHDDREPSLSIREGDDVAVVLRCHAGCSFDDVMVAITGGERSHRVPPRPISVPKVPTFSTRMERGREVVRYAYVTGGLRDRRLVHWIVRYDPKAFRPLLPDGLTYRLPEPADRVLYRQLDVLGAVDHRQPVWLVEGEKDANTLTRRAGVIATTAPMGASSPWQPQFTETLRGARLTVVADRDVPGYRRALAVARLLSLVADDVRLVEAAVGKDATDHLCAGLGLADFREVTL